jgi:hypothetical protein
MKAITYDNEYHLIEKDPISKAIGLIFKGRCWYQYNKIKRLAH